MSLLRRTMLLTLFAAGGAGVAVALATTGELPDDATANTKRETAQLRLESVEPRHDRHDAEDHEAQGAREHPLRPGLAFSARPNWSPANPAVTAQVAPPASDANAQAVQALSDVVKSLMSKSAEQPPAKTSSPSAADSGPRPGSQAEEVSPSGKSPVARRAPAETAPNAGTPQITAEGDGLLTIHCRDSDLREVLELISQQGNLNILAGKSVTGKVTASINNVDLESALSAILKSTGYTWQREGKFIHVGTQADLKAADNVADRLGTRIYRPNYINAKELEQLVTPLLSETVGKVKATTPAKTGMAADGNTAGGDDYTGAETVIVRDYENVLLLIDQLVEEMDRRPTQVAIEAMILSVKLDDTHKFGVDFQLLRDKPNVVLASGSPPSSLGQVSFDDGGLKFGFLDTSLGAFLNAVETIGDANIIATPRVLCLNRQRAEILIGAQLGYVNTTQTETSSTQSVDFLEVGTQLRIRPYISTDGMVRLEVHPELSTGSVRVEQNFTLPDKEVTQVTSNVMVRDGSTVIIGGLIRDELTETATQMPLLGSLPWVGWAFRSSTQSTERREILILITPHIVYEPEVSLQGDKAAREFHHQHMVYADRMSPIGKRFLGRKYFHKAQRAWAEGDQKKALYLINLAVHFDPMNRQAIDLRSDITSNNRQGDHTDLYPPRVGPNLHPLDGAMLAPWLVEQLQSPPPAFPLRHPVDSGMTNPSLPIGRQNEAQRLLPSQNQPQRSEPRREDTPRQEAPPRPLGMRSNQPRNYATDDVSPAAYADASTAIAGRSP